MNKQPENLDNYRWYTCYEDKLNSFVCSQTTGEKAIANVSHPQEPRCIAIPIHKYVPSLFDKTFLCYNLRQDFVVKKD
jgi:hypothetical protein